MSVQSVSPDILALSREPTKRPNADTDNVNGTDHPLSHLEGAVKGHTAQSASFISSSAGSSLNASLPTCGADNSLSVRGNDVLESVDAAAASTAAAGVSDTSASSLAVRGTGSLASACPVDERNATTAPTEEEEEESPMLGDAGDTDRFISHESSFYNSLRLDNLHGVKAVAVPAACTPVTPSTGSRPPMSPAPAHSTSASASAVSPVTVHDDGAHSSGGCTFNSSASRSLTNATSEHSCRYRGRGSSHAGGETEGQSLISLLPPPATPPISPAQQSAFSSARKDRRTKVSACSPFSAASPCSVNSLTELLSWRRNLSQPGSQECGSPSVPPSSMSQESSVHSAATPTALGALRAAPSSASPDAEGVSELSSPAAPSTNTAVGSVTVPEFSVPSSSLCASSTPRGSTAGSRQSSMRLRTADGAVSQRTESTSSASPASRAVDASAVPSLPDHEDSDDGLSAVNPLGLRHLTSPQIGPPDGHEKNEARGAADSLSAMSSSSVSSSTNSSFARSSSNCSSIRSLGSTRSSSLHSSSQPSHRHHRHRADRDQEKMTYYPIAFVRALIVEMADIFVDKEEKNSIRFSALMSLLLFAVLGLYLVFA